MYLVANLDWYACYVVSWELDQTVEMSFVLRAVEQPIALASPIIVNNEEAQSIRESAVYDSAEGPCSA